MMSPAGSPRPFTGWHMIAVMAAFFGVVIAVNITLAVLANKTWSGLIVNNGYDPSQHFKQEEERLRKQAALGWSATVVPSLHTVTVTMLDAGQKPLTGLEVSGVLKRTVTDSQDKAVTFASTDAGVYRATAEIGAGKWNIELTARDQMGHAFLQTYHFLVEPAAQ